MRKTWWNHDKKSVRTPIEKNTHKPDKTKTTTREKFDPFCRSWLSNEALHWPDAPVEKLLNLGKAELEKMHSVQVGVKKLKPIFYVLKVLIFTVNETKLKSKH